MFRAGEGFIARRKAALTMAVIRKVESSEEREEFLARIEGWAKRMKAKPHMSAGEVRWLEGRLRQARLPAQELRALLLDDGPTGTEARHAMVLTMGLSREEVRACESLARGRDPILPPDTQGPDVAR